MLSRWLSMGVVVLLAGCSGDGRPADAKSASSDSKDARANATPASSEERRAPTTQPSRADLSKIGRAFGGGDTSPAGLPPGHPPVDGRPAAPAPQPSPPPQSATPLRYDPPEGWVVQPASSAMRKAQFALPKAAGDAEDGDMILFYFGAGQGGSVTDNLARWRGMFTDAEGKPVPAEAVVSETFQANGLSVTTLDVAGRYAPAAMPGVPQPAGPKDNYRMLAAVVDTPAGPWFFRGVGPSGTMGAHRERFLRMLRSVRVSD